jgi:hypothetical protein
MAKVAECLTSKCRALNSNTSTEKKGETVICCLLSLNLGMLYYRAVYNYYK